MDNSKQNNLEITLVNLRKVEFQQRAILDNIPDIAWLKDAQGRFIAVNQPFAKACGLKVEEIIGKTDLDIWPKELALSYRADDQKVMDSKKRKCVQERLMYQEGGEQWIETIKTPFFNDHDEIIGTTGIARNITLHKNETERLKEIRAELELRVKVRTSELVSFNEALRKEIRERKVVELGLVESENKFRMIFELSSDGMVIMEIASKEFISGNKTFWRMLGYNDKEMQQIGVKDIHLVKDLPFVFEEIERLSKKDIFISSNVPVKRKDGSIFYADISATQINLNSKECLLGSFRDVTERKKNDEEIQKSLSLHHATLEGSRDGILIVSSNGGIVSNNRRFLELWRIPDDLSQTRDDKKLLEYVLDQLVDPKGFLNEVQRLYNNPKEESCDTLMFKDGRVFERFSLPQKIKNTIVGRVWSFRDVTQNKKYENELKIYHEKLEFLVGERTRLLESEIASRKEVEERANSLRQQLEFILGATKTGLDIIDKDFNLHYVDPEWARNYGDWKGKKCYAYFMGRKSSCARCAIEEAFRTKKAVVSEEILTKEGDRPVQVTTIPFQDKNGEWLVAEVNVDIMQKKKIDEELKRYRNDLEELVGERTEELRREANRYKTAELEKNKLNRELIKTNKKLRSVSLIDALTGLYNYRYLKEAIEVEFHQARRYAQNLAIIMLDVDYFKSINDVYGIAFGDLVLKQLAKQLKRMVRRYDILIRYSGEEFIIISPRLNRFTAFNLAQRLQDSLNFTNFGNKKHSVKLKISLSVVSFPDDRAKNGMDLVNLADMVLNKAKESGGNRTYSFLDVKKQSGKGVNNTSKIVGIKTLKNTINKLNKQSKQGLSESIFAFAKTLELKDHYTGEHVENTVHFATGVAQELNLPKEDVELIKQAARLHDLGKIGVSENILLKKSKLNKKEFDEIKKHPQIGADIIRPIQFLHDLIPFIFYHHERWDGKGYPSGIRGEDIPLGARVIAIADVYQALISDRPYHKAFTKSAAIDIIKKSSGTQFDPRIVSAFLRVVNKEK